MVGSAVGLGISGCLQSQVYVTSLRGDRSSTAERGSRGCSEPVPPSLAVPGVLLLMPRLMVHEQRSRTHGQLHFPTCLG